MEEGTCVWGPVITTQPHARLLCCCMRLQGSSPRPPLLFIHGSYHSAWCWQVRVERHGGNQG